MYEPNQPAERTQEVPSKIRPIWLFGGGAALAIVGMCALISLVVAVPIVWLTVQRSSQDQTTQVAIGHPTAQPVTVIPLTSIIISPPTGIVITPLPTIGFSTQSPPIAFPTPIMLTTQNPTSRLAPDQAVRTYFQLVGAGRYDLTWPMLTDAFKQKFNCCNPNYNYAGYTAWWDSVNTVDFGNVNVVSQNGDRAVVYAELFYNMNSGARSSVDSNPYIALVYDSAMGGWRFDDKRASP